MADTAMTAEQVRVARNRAVTGVLTSEPSNRDVKFDSFSLMVGGNQLVNDCRIELNAGCRYGLIGDNGTGKSNVLAAIAQRDVPLPTHIDVFHLHEEAPTSDMTAVEAVIAHIVEEAKRLEELSAQIMEESPDGAEDPRLEALFERIDELDTTGAEPRARSSGWLAGDCLFLGFVPWLCDWGGGPQDPLWPRLQRRQRPDGPEDEAHERRLAHARVAGAGALRAAVAALARRAHEPPGPRGLRLARAALGRVQKQTSSLGKTKQN